MYTVQIVNLFSYLPGLLKHYNPSHPDYHSTSMALVKIQSIIGKMSIRLRETVSVNDIFADAPSRGKTKVASLNAF